VIHDADYCPTCGQPRDRAVQSLERMGLRLNHTTLSYGSRSARLRPAHRAFLQTLLQHGRASEELICLRVCPNTESNLVQVYACHLRKIIRDLTDDQLALRSIWGWGYELVSQQMQEAA
jgi:DNA-binding response OmpR family regulator